MFSVLNLKDATCHTQYHEHKYVLTYNIVLIINCNIHNVSKAFKNIQVVCTSDVVFHDLPVVRAKDIPGRTCGD